jgi:hypothetical protein
MPSFYDVDVRRDVTIKGNLVVEGTTLLLEISGQITDLDVAPSDANARAGFRVLSEDLQSTRFEVTEFSVNSNNPIACPFLSMGGVNVYSGETTPGGTIPTNSIWLSSAGLQIYNGSVWGPPA